MLLLRNLLPQEGRLLQEPHQERQGSHALPLWRFHSSCLDNEAVEVGLVSVVGAGTVLPFPFAGANLRFHIPIPNALTVLSRVAASRTFHGQNPALDTAKGKPLHSPSRMSCRCISP